MIILLGKLLIYRLKNLMKNLFSFGKHGLKTRQFDHRVFIDVFIELILFLT